MSATVGDKPKEESTVNNREAVELDIMELQVMAPEVVLHIPGIFREAVQDSLLNILGEDTAKALTIMVGEPALEDPDAVFSTLDSILRGPGSDILKGAIKAEFQVMIRRLLEKATLGHFAEMDSLSLEQEAFVAP